MQAAHARGVDVLIVDTAGRLHTKHNLMAELTKLRRIMQKTVPEAPQETILVIDATTGQNGLVQAKEFAGAVDISDILIAKLDGTAKGGIAFSVAKGWVRRSRTSVPARRRPTSPSSAPTPMSTRSSSARARGSEARTTLYQPVQPIVFDSLGPGVPVACGSDVDTTQLPGSRTASTTRRIASTTSSGRSCCRK